MDCNRVLMTCPVVRPLWGSVRNASRGIILVLLIPGLLH